VCAGQPMAKMLIVDDNATNRSLLTTNSDNP
jgi:CheY-like chemotaxis protein